MALQTIAPAGWAAQFSNARGRTTTNELAASIKPTHFEELVRWDADDDGDGKGTLTRDGGAAPLVTLMSFVGNKSETIDNYRFETWEQRPAATFVIVDSVGTPLGTETTIPLVDGEASRLQEGQTLYNPVTGERMRIPWLSTNISETNNNIVNVQRGLENGGVGSVILPGAKLEIMAPSRPEGAQDGTPRGYLDETDYNYTQEMSASVAITERDEVLKQWSGRDFAMAKKETQRDFRRQIERTLLFSVRSVGTDATDGYQYTMTSGIVQAIKTNRQDVSGVALTWEAFNDILEPFFLYGEGVKHAFCGPTVRNLLHGFVDKSMLRMEVIQMSGREVQGITFGWQVDKLATHWGTLVLHSMKGWAQNEGLRDKMLIIDPTKLTPVYRRGGNVQLRPSPQVNGATFTKSTWYADMGLRTYVEGAHGIIEGFGKP